MTIQTVDVNAIEWLDKVNGNSYHVAVVTLNFGLKNEIRLKSSFTYGYGTQYCYTALKLIQDAGYLPKDLNNKPYWKVYDDLGITYRHSIKRVAKRNQLYED